MSQVVVYLDEARVHTFTGKRDQEIMLRPGRNVVDSEMLDAVSKKNEQLKELVESGVVTIAGDRVDITTMDSKRAVQVIDMETTVDGVKELLDQELKAEKPRKPVVAAAKVKITAIGDGAKKDADTREVKTEVRAKVASGGAN